MIDPLESALEGLVRLSNLPGFKIIDSSFLFEKNVFAKDSPSEKSKVLEREEQIIRTLINKKREDFLYTEETASEIGCYITLQSRSQKAYQRSTRKMKKERRTANIWPGRATKEEAMRYLASLDKSISTLKTFRKKCILRHKPIDLMDLKIRDRFMNPVLKATEKSYLGILGRTANKFIGPPEHFLNDARIYAKSILLGLSKPDTDISIASADKDFLLMHKYFWERALELSTEHEFPLPERGITLIHSNEKRGLKFYHSSAYFPGANPVLIARSDLVPSQQISISHDSY